MGGASSVAKPSKNGGVEYKETLKEAPHQSHISVDQDHTAPTEDKYQSICDDREDDINREGEHEFISQEDDQYVPETPRTAAATAAASDVFAQTAMSLDMDNDDLLFNLLYFQSLQEGGGRESLENMVNSVQSETVALHSENNTPYKLKPASEKSIAGLAVEEFMKNDVDLETECAICKDEIDFGDKITRLPSCRHYFHHDCLIRWINLQGWCPVCRAEIDTEQIAQGDQEEDAGHNHDPNRLSEHIYEDGKCLPGDANIYFDYKNKGEILGDDDSNTASSSPFSRSLFADSGPPDDYTSTTSNRSKDWNKSRADKHAGHAGLEVESLAKQSGEESKEEEERTLVVL